MFENGQRVRINGTYRNNALGTVVGFSEGAYQVRLDSGEVRSFTRDTLLDSHANNGD